jgi:hypothetical protein
MTLFACIIVSIVLFESRNIVAKIIAVILFIGITDTVFRAVLGVSLNRGVHSVCSITESALHGAVSVVHVIINSFRSV